jgi:hypothetical protein
MFKVHIIKAKDNKVFAKFKGITLLKLFLVFLNGSGIFSQPFSRNPLYPAEAGMPLLSGLISYPFSVVGFQTTDHR